MGAEVAAGALALPEGDAVADQYALLQAALAEAGYRQYELSNWARPGHESVHNLTYWRNGQYVGLGAGAAGSFDGARYKRTPVVRDYIAAAESGDPGLVEWEPWTHERQMRDTVMLGLRLAEGISESAFVQRFGVSLVDYCAASLQSLIANDVLRLGGDRLSLNPAFYFVCNTVLGEILP
jgi:oxygen-independent coproporphyrinogen-3 oxidase